MTPTIPKTLLQLAGADLTPACIEKSTLVLIDYQNEYLSGPVALPVTGPAIAAAVALLASARRTGAPVIHVAHKGRSGGLFDRAAERGQIVPVLSPEVGEAVVEKTFVGAFASTNLLELLTKADRKDVIIAGFMTHNCVSSTARAASDAGFRVTIGANACATRDLPDGQGGVIRAVTVQAVALAELSDRIAIVAADLVEQA